jgi:hypothetical protein
MNYLIITSMFIEQTLIRCGLLNLPRIVLYFLFNCSFLLPYDVSYYSLSHDLLSNYLLLKLFGYMYLRAWKAVAMYSEVILEQILYPLHFMCVDY